MSRCSDPRDLAELDPVTFFLVTERMAAEKEAQISDSDDDEILIPAFERSQSKAA